jgi:antitoxin (DNA-binding transcriptional repressor) of toxin-antitoxin stability system
MATISLRELIRNPSQAVARVRAGASLIVLDQGKPVLRMVPEDQHLSLLHQMISAGEARPPVEAGMPEVLIDLEPEVGSLAGLLIADRGHGQGRR